MRRYGELVQRVELGLVKRVRLRVRVRGGDMVRVRAYP